VVRQPAAAWWIFAAAAAAGGRAFVAYDPAVPANRYGDNVYAARQLKTIQDVVTLTVFGVRGGLSAAGDHPDSDDVVIPDQPGPLATVCRNGCYRSITAREGV
jgi:hypothetical protein